MKLVIIESPYKGDVERNVRYLRSCIRDCLKRGESPYASHRMLTDALDDNDPEERMLGIEAGLAWAHVQQPVFDGDPADGCILKHNLVCHAFYVDLGVSDGMLLARKRFFEDGLLWEERRLPTDDPFFASETLREKHSLVLLDALLDIVGSSSVGFRPKTSKIYAELARRFQGSSLAKK